LPLPREREGNFFFPRREHALLPVAANGVREEKFNLNKTRDKKEVMAILFGWWTFSRVLGDFEGGNHV
jgi:hypothetical protein